MLLNGMVKILKVNRGGKTSNGLAYVHCSAISYDNNEQFIMVKAFGSEAEFIQRNLKGARRAFVSGNLKVDTYTEDMEVTKSLVINGAKKTVKFKVQVEKTGLSLEAHAIQFIDKAKSDDEVEIVDGCDEDVIILDDEDIIEDGEDSNDVVEAGSEMVVEADVVEEKKPTRRAGKRK